MKTVACLALIVGTAGAAAAQGYGARGPYSNGGAIIVDQNGGYHGNANSNPYDPNSVSNPYGRYGNRYSPDSINNPYGAGNPYNGSQYRVLGR
ncbi:hypothetical protein Q8W71_04670 [Methylobacterium sp. NEAU 140]|uniref:hypothetical protein n=1 Tax=Methylobacterium sp. NEAU 140 TaxID=3064945 RepID=UPI0027349F87|nr:hypothetical protein [Methylobacterium sp. NEAU 140]MDP4021911.1 hypothetical protein [Methylobacterium sp. NEAU 140]